MTRLAALMGPAHRRRARSSASVHAKP